MQVISCEANAIRRVITVTWRIEGAVNVGPGLEIMPYVVSTDLSVGEDGLIVVQEDRCAPTLVRVRFYCVVGGHRLCHAEA